MRVRVVLIALLALALMSVGLAPGADAEQSSPSDDGSANLASTVGSLQAIFPGFYAVDSFALPDPVDVEVDPATGYVWLVSESGNEIEVVRPDGTAVMTVGAIGAGDGEYGFSTAITIHDGVAFVGDYSNERVVVFDTDGNFLRNIDNQGDRPCAVFAHGSRLFVRSDVTSTLRVYNANTGAIINSVDGADSGTAYEPTVCDGNSIAQRSNEIYFTDPVNDRVMVFDVSLNWDRDLPIPDAGGIDIAQDTIWVTDADNAADEIRQHSLAGTELARFDLSGATLGELDFPLGIEVDPAGSTFWVAEGHNNRVQAFTRLRCGGDLLTIVGTAYDDNFDGTPGADVMHLGEGNDTTNGGIADDTICGGGGNDVILGSDGNDSLRGQDGNDTLDGELGDDELYGGRGNDTAYGFDGDDDIFGGDDDDKLFGGKGADDIEGEAGDDTLHGNRGNDRLGGGDGNDRIFGYSENDTIDGGDGDDRLHGHFGDDIINGGPGNDRMFGYGDDDVLNGGDGDDLIGGNFGNDELNGDDGNDTLYGSGDNDEVNGGPGNDSVDGNSGNDVLTGGGGNDALDGGINNDTCNGNSGTDTATRCETVLGVP